MAYLDGMRGKVEKLKKYQESQLKDLAELKQSILDKAFKGELIAKEGEGHYLRGRRD